MIVSQYSKREWAVCGMFFWTELCLILMKIVEPTCAPVAIAAEQPRSVGDCEAEFYIEGEGPSQADRSHRSHDHELSQSHARPKQHSSFPERAAGSAQALPWRRPEVPTQNRSTA